MTTFGETVYTKDYFDRYDLYGGGRQGPMLPFMQGLAVQFCLRFPLASRILEAGCAFGYLIEALRDCGREAIGFDASPYAISQVREDCRPHVWVADLARWTPSQSYHLVICIEVVEHLPPEDAEAAIAHLCAAAERWIVFSSTPSDFSDPTHLNVRPTAYWRALFERHGFTQTDTALYISPQAIELERA